MDLYQHHQPHTTTAAATNPNPNRAEAERLLGIAEKLLQTRDLTGSREFALLAQETEPLLEGTDQILAITDVLLASERLVIKNRHHDWYAILQVSRQSLSSDPDLLKRNYRRLALLLHPDKNRYSLADSAFKLVADAWALLSDPSRKELYDHELSVYEKIELQPQTQSGTIDKDKLPIRRSPRGGGMSTESSKASPPPMASGNNNKNHSRGSTVSGGRGGGAAGKTANFWTACPYCYVLYEYPRGYEECCIRCQSCERAFHANVINSLPPIVPGKEAYYCCWGFFPLGFSLETNTKGSKKAGSHQNVNANNNSRNPNWAPAAMFTTQAGGPNVNINMPYVNASVGGVDVSDGSASAGLGNNNTNNVPAGFPSVPSRMGMQPAKKRGRPRKNPLSM